MLELYYVMGKALSDELSCMRTGLVMLILEQGIVRVFLSDVLSGRV